MRSQGTVADRAPHKRERERICATRGSGGSLFELFQDDDVLNLFEMREPSDPAFQGQSDFHQQLGVVDQRVEAWFEPFGWVIPTGYLRNGSEAP